MLFRSVSQSRYDGTTTPAGVFLNFAVPDAGISASDSITVNGTVTVIYNVAGDN